MNQYNNIAQQYDITEQTIAKKYTYGSTLTKLCGSLKGKRVVDVACGTGYSTRVIKTKCKPAAIVGLDSSRAEIDIALAHEKVDKLGIEYAVGKAENFNFKKLGQIDVITALFLLHYSPTKTHMRAVCKNLYRALSPSGTFVTISPNPTYPIMRYKKYEITSRIKGKKKEGAQRVVTYWHKGKKLCEFTNYYWHQETYEKELLAAGFKEVKFYKPTISPAGYRKYGRAFWKEYLSEPHIIGIVCKK